MEQPASGQPSAAGGAPIDPTNLPESNLTLAILGGVVAALIGAAIWAVITVKTGYQVGFMAIGVGLLVGFTVRHLGKGATPAFGAVGALLSLAGCVAGNVLAIAGFIAQEEGQPFFCRALPAQRGGGARHADGDFQRDRCSFLRDRGV